MRKNTIRPSYWTAERISEFIKDYPDMPINELSNKYKVSVAAIYSQATLLGIRRNSPRSHSSVGKSKYSQEQKKFVLENYARLSGEELSRILGVPHSTIRVWIFRQRKRNERKTKAE